MHSHYFAGCEMQLEEEFRRVGCNAVQSVESILAFWRNILPTYSGRKNKPSKKPVIDRRQVDPCWSPDYDWFLTWLTLGP